MAARPSTKPSSPWINTERLWVHVALALFTVVGCQFAVIFDPSAILAEPLSLGTGYVALLYIAVSLLIGPLYLARRRRNPVNIYLRRDIGIWAGITSLLHVAISFQVFNQGQILLYFFRQVSDRYLPDLSLFGLSNYIGLLAAALVLVLLVLSNDLALRWLKGRRWKFIQRLTYPLAVLAVLHTFGYQIDNARDAVFVVGVLALSLVVALAQGSGVMVHLRRQAEVVARARTRTNGQAASARAIATPYLVPQDDADAVSRRRFLLYSGATLLAGFAGLVSFRITQQILMPPGRAPASRPPNGAAPPAIPRRGAASPTVPEANAAPPTATTRPAPTSTADAGVPTAPEANAVPPTAITPPAPTATAVAAPPANPGIVLATLTSCPLNSALNFSAPDTGETCILIHEADGSVKAFSNVCTHRPYPVDYDPNSQALVCPLHLALFSATSGAVTRGPARRALDSIPVHVDGQGNIIYG